MAMPYIEAASPWGEAPGLCYSTLMNDRPKNAAETPLARALRMKKAAIEAKPKPPGAGKAQRERAAGIAAGVSKPWMKK
jgi:hypothetical protein